MNRPTVRIRLDRIDASQRLRSVDPDYVAMIAASMVDRGQDTPIDVRPADPDVPEDGYILITGGHRYEAVRSIGWSEIDARVFEGTALEARLLEIDENLCRRELSALDRATFLAERKAIYEELHPETRHGGDRAGGQVANLATWANRFTAEVAERVGLSERSVQRAITRFGRIAPDVRSRLALSPFADKGGELDALTRLEPAEQRAVVGLLLDGGEDAPTSVGAALRQVRGERAPASDASEAQFQALVRAWGKGDRRARSRFLDHLFSADDRVFDRWLQQREDALAGDGEAPEAGANDDTTSPKPRGRRAA